MADADRATPFGVYVHWPFCLSKCPYCDFNSHVRQAAIDQPRYVAAFTAEIAATAARIPGRTVSTIFFGGGTPSLMAPATVGAVLDAIARHWTVAPDAEITLEANPTSVEATRFRGYRAAGVNRVSLGVQSLDDAVLRQLGRLHTAREALDAVAVARAMFERYSFDLIYARPGQTLTAWRNELAAALAQAGEHLSLYQLTIEPETPFAALQPLPLPLDLCRPSSRVAACGQGIALAAMQQPAMSAGPDAGILAVAPIEQVVAALGARPRVVGNLVGGQTRCCAGLEGEVVERACGVVVRHDELAGVRQRRIGRVLLDGELVEREMLCRLADGPFQFAAPRLRRLARPCVDQVERIALE